MNREEHVLNETFSYRYPGKDADYVILIQHGIASVPSRATSPDTAQRLGLNEFLQQLTTRRRPLISAGYRVFSDGSWTRPVQVAEREGKEHNDQPALGDQAL